MGQDDKNVVERFCHLHNHSYYSILDGMASPKQMVQAAYDHGFKSLAITDHGTCGGLLAFQKACLEKGIKPILGMETYITADHTIKDKDTRTYHLNLLAKNIEGVRNLTRLSSIAEIKGKYRRPRIDFDLLKRHSQGLICTSSCPAGELSTLLQANMIEEADKLALQYRELFKDDYYIEIMMHKYFESKKDQEEREEFLAKQLYALSKRTGIKPICTNDAHYAKKSDAVHHDVLLSIQTHDVIKNPDRFTFGGNQFYIKSYEEMEQTYSWAPELLSNTVEIANKVECPPKGLLQFSPDLLPHFDIPKGFADEDAYLKALVVDGMKSKGLINNPIYRARAKYEMSFITKCGFVRYFLILWDIINYAKEQGIRVGIGRGSAAGSLCLYVLGVTKLDPIKYDLLFERFINPERVSPPDVDIDFDYFLRDKIFEYVYRKYGHEFCSKIGTYNRLKAKAVVRYSIKALDLGGDWEIYQKAKEKNPHAKPDQTKNSLDLSQYIAKMIPEAPNLKLEEALRSQQDFRSEMERYPYLLDTARNLENTVSSAGVHPAGIIICKNPIADQIPLRDGKGQICSQFDGPEVEELGLLKFDFLALKTLTVVDETIKLIKKRHNIDLDIDNLEPNDKKVFALLNGAYQKMDNRGIFQFEAPGISKLLKHIHVDTFEDMIVANALYRPGPLGAGVHDLYCDYKHKRKPIEPLHPKMGEVLKQTYGIMIFQENLMRVAQELAGFTLGQADILRKVVGKKKIELIKKENLDNLFYDGCAKNGIDKATSEKIFEQIKYFGEYGFNRSHSACYAYLAYQTAYLKVYYPIEFMCSLMSSEIDNNDQDLKLKAYQAEADRMGIAFMKRDINKSGLKFSIESGKRIKDGSDYEFIRMPLTTLKGVGDKAVKNIVEMQPFRSLKDFLYKVDGRKVNSRVFAALVEDGCMEDAWSVSKGMLMSKYQEVKDSVEKMRKDKKKEEEEDNYLDSVGGSLFDRMSDSDVEVSI